MATKLSEQGTLSRFTWSDRAHWVVEPQQERSRKTMRKILDAAATLFMSQGFDTTTVAQIARNAEISAGSLYRRFPDKEAVLHTVLDSYFKTRVAELDQMINTSSVKSMTPAETITFYVDMIFSAYQHDADIIRLYEHRALSDSLVREMAARNSHYVASRIGAILYPKLEWPISRVDEMIACLHTVLRATLVHEILPEEPASWPNLDILGNAFKDDMTQMAIAWFGLQGETNE